MVDGEKASESWSFIGRLFRGHVTRNGLGWKAQLWCAIGKEGRRPGECVTSEHDTPEAARAEVEIQMRLEWLELPEAKWGMPVRES
jgi:hypothetical protein